MLITNRIDTEMNYDAIDAQFDIFEVQKTGEEKLSWASRVFEPFGAPYILSLFAQGSDKPFYILAPKDAVNEKGLTNHFENNFAGKIGDEDFESEKIALSLLPKKVGSANVPTRALVQLLLNALYSGNTGETTSLQNVTGHLYCFKANSKWIKASGNDGRRYQIMGLEFRLTSKMLLAVSVVTFTRANIKGLKFKARKREAYPRYIIDFSGPTMRRVAPGERPDENDVYIKKQFEGQKNRIDFLCYDSRDSFLNSKCGVLQELISRFNATYKGLAHISFASMDESDMLCSPRKLVKADYKTWFSRSELVIVDIPQDAASEIVCREVADRLVEYDLPCRRPRIVSEPIEGANNLVVIHSKDYYKDKGVQDPYQSNHEENLACQHLTVETIQLELGKKNPKNSLRAILLKCLLELAVKEDIQTGALRLFDWGGLGLDEPLVFAKPGPETEEEKDGRKRDDPPRRYSFLEIAPDATLQFHLGNLDSASDEDRWDRLAFDLAAGWSPKAKGFIIGTDDSFDVIEDTDGFPVPNLDKVKEAVKSVDWSLPKSDVLSVLSVAYGDPDIDSVLKDLCARVMEVPDSRIKSKKLSGFVVEACGDAAPNAKRVRAMLNQQFEDMFAIRLQTVVPRNSEAKRNVYDPIVGIQCFMEDDCLCYCVSDFDLKQSGRANGAVIRKVRNSDGGDPLILNLFETLTVPVSRIGKPSVLPLPFKYLDEYMRSVSL